MSIDLDDYIESTRKELEDERIILDETDESDEPDESNRIIFSWGIHGCHYNSRPDITKIKIIFKSEHISHDDLYSIKFSMGWNRSDNFVYCGMSVDVNLLDLILLYTNLKTTVRSNEVTIFLPKYNHISFFGYKFGSLISAVYGYKTTRAIKIPKYLRTNYALITFSLISKIIVRILDDSSISLCSVKYYNSKIKFLFEYNLNFDSAIKNSRFPNYYIFDVSKNMIKEINNDTENYNVIFYDEYENIIDCEYEIRFYTQLLD